MLHIITHNNHVIKDIMKSLFTEHPMVWIDLEMTGLDPDHDVILEVATIITDPQLHVIATGPHIIVHWDNATLDRMIPIVREMHTTSGLLDRVAKSTVSINQAMHETFKFIKQYADEKKSPLCGNSIWCDRNFLYKVKPELISFLHYRMVDVSTVKVLVNNWYPYSNKIGYKKNNVHRALDDIIESINELKHYRELFFKKI